MDAKLAYSATLQPLRKTRILIGNHFQLFVYAYAYAYNNCMKSSQRIWE